MSKEVDYWRQLDMFSPHKFKTPITVIGAGATGSYVVWLLAKMGCRNITVYDNDVVENHNLPNQLFGLKDIGKKKVNALAEIIKAETGITITPIAKHFKDEKVEGIVFVLTDTMKSRKSIWDKSLKYKLGVQFVLETRMAIDGGRIYAINPCVVSHVENYEKTLYSDKKAEPSACSNQAIAPTVTVISGLAVFTMLNFINKKPFHNEVIISLSPTIVLSKKF